MLTADLCMPGQVNDMLRGKDSITIFRFDRESGKWESFILKNAMIHYCRAINEGFRGVKYSGQSIIRVSLKNPQDIYCGDKVAIGRHFGDCPSDALTVTGVTDNSRGTSYVRHIKLICEG